MSTSLSIEGGSVGVAGSTSGRSIDVERLHNLDRDSLSDDEKEVLEAEDFIIYGKASIEQYDRDNPPQKISMSAIEEALPQFFALDGMISRRHKDVKVGEALKEWTLDEDTTIYLNDETLEFQKGDVLRTEVKGDTLWLVANIFSDWNDERGSLLSNQTRLGAYHGKLDGFSVTIFTRDFDSDGKGQDVNEIDLFSVTIGDDKLVKNKGSEFGVAEFKMLGEMPLRKQINSYMGNRIYNHLFGKSQEALAFEVITHAHEKEVPLDEAAESVVDEGDPESVADTADEKLQEWEEELSEKQDEDDRRDLAAAVADELDLSTGEVLELFEQMDEDGEGESKEHPEDEDEDEDNGEERMKMEEVEETIEEKLDERLDGVVTEEQLGEKMEELNEKLEDGLDGVGEDIAESISEKMETGGTQSPESGGGGENEVDLDNQINEFQKKFEV